jgi:hypothetical protein
VGTGKIKALPAAGEALAFLQTGVSGLAATALVFLALSLILARAGQKRLA